MRFGDKENKLGRYIVISIIIHLLIIFFFPFGALQGMADEGGSGSRDFGFIQFVEIQSTSTITSPESKTQTEETEEIDEEKMEEKEEEKEEIEDTRKEEAEETKEETENKISIEEETAEESTEDIPEEAAEETEEETESTGEQEILTSEESEVEIEKKEKDEEVIQKKEKNIEENKVDSSEQKAEEVPPPPPPTAGELIGLSPRPVYPKYLVSEQKTGKVELNVHVNKHGEIENIETINSSGIETMDRNAVLTIENGWEFRNYQKPYMITLTINYQIDDKGNTKVNIDLQNVNFK